MKKMSHDTGVDVCVWEREKQTPLPLRELLPFNPSAETALQPLNTPSASTRHTRFGRLETFWQRWRLPFQTRARRKHVWAWYFTRTFSYVLRKPIWFLQALHRALYVPASGRDAARAENYLDRYIDMHIYIYIGSRHKGSNLGPSCLGPKLDPLWIAFLAPTYTTYFEHCHFIIILLYSFGFRG